MGRVTSNGALEGRQRDGCRHKANDRRRDNLRRPQASALLWDHQRIDGLNHAIASGNRLFRR
jgi:hypothetical protein